MKKLILASTSPRRKELLEKLGLDFEVVTSDYEEDMTLPLPANELAKVLALGKAQDVADKYPDAVVIGSDTMVVFDGKVIGKPKDETDAKEILKKLSGQKHSVVTGVAIINKSLNQELVWTDEAFVQFRNISEEEIDKYIDSGEPFGHAGAYAIQKKACVFVEEIVGDFSVIIGLPQKSVSENLKQFGVEIF